MYRNIGLGSWIARRAAMAPDRIALVFEQRRWTYRELDQRTTRLARAFAMRGVGRGDRVAFLGHNHPAALETLFACGLLGAVYVPLHPGFDDAALTGALVDSGARLLLFTPELAGAVSRIRSRVSVEQYAIAGPIGDEAERYQDWINDASDEPIDRAVSLDDPCLIGFSSGTTGRNKGVVLTHGNLLFNAINVLSCLDMVSDDVLLVSAPLYRMGGLGFLLPVLLKGGTAVLQAGADAERSLALIERQRASILFDSTNALDAIRRSPSFARADLSSVRICATGGSTVPAELVEAFAQRGLALQQGYGLTEASPLALMIHRDEIEAHPTAAGRPPMFCAARVVDDDLEDVPPGRVGELLVYGPNVTRGYWRRADATAAAFVEDGWLRTGDTAIVADDGVITIVGRRVDSLVLGGDVLHPAPVEAKLCGDTGALECAVVQRAAGARPTIFVVARAGAEVEPGSVLAAWRAHVPAGDPPHVALVDALPKNANGKILRRRLREQAAA